MSCKNPGNFLDTVRKSLIGIFALVLAVSSTNGFSLVSRGKQETVQEPWLIDSFSRSDGRSELGTSWRGFSDRVMGGISSVRFAIKTIQGRSVDIPFTFFFPENLEIELNASLLKHIAIVGAWDNFEADVAVSRLEFYK